MKKVESKRSRYNNERTNNERTMINEKLKYSRE
jgi:hypothetical protein